MEPMQSDFHEMGSESASHDHTHLALIYETQAELFASAVPFLQAGLERGEQCLYIADETTNAAIVKAMETAGIDVETAREADDLSLSSPAETYFNDGEFDPTKMIGLLEEQTREAQEGYEQLRVAGEMLAPLADDNSIENLLDYEAALTEFFATRDSLAMCMYDRERFPAAVLDDVIQHHPQVVYDGAVSQNVYYVPPDEEQPQQAVDRQLQTLVDQTTAREQRETALEDRTNKLEEAHNQLEAAANAGSVGLWTWDIQNDDLTADEYVAESYGIDPTNAATGAPIEAFFASVHEDDRERVVGQVDEAVEQTGELDTEYRVWNADGDIMWVVARGEVDYAADGDPLRLHGAISDITERKRQEQLQEEQTRLLERITAGASLEECLTALCSSVSHLNPDARASILLTDEERESFHRPIAPDLQPSWCEGLEGAPITDLMIGTCSEAVFRGTPVTCEDVATDDRWSEEWRELCVANSVMAGHSTPIHDEDGDPLGLFMLCFDEPKTPNEWEQRLADFGTHITSIAIERARSRRALRDSEERQRLALEGGEMGVWELDLQTNDSPVRSPRHAEIFGYEEREDWSFETLLDHVHPDDRKQVEESFEEAFQTGELEFESRIIRADDEQRWITASGEFYDDDDEPVRAIGTVQDITDRKEREQRLARQREQIETLQNRLLETSPTGIVVFDAANDVTLANDRAQEILGRTSEDLTGFSYDAPAFDFVDANGDPIPDAELPFERARRTGDAVFGVEVGATQPDGQRIWLSINAAPLYDEQANEPTEIVVAFEDITDHKQANDAFAHLNTASRELMDADPQTINERAAGITQEVLDVAYTSLWHYDEETGDLQHHTSSTASGIDPASIRYPEEFEERAWQTFISTEMDASNEFPPISDSIPSEKPLRSGVILPLGRHGVICTGSLSPGMFDEMTVDLAETVAATIETALDRAADEQELARHNEELTRLNRINNIIRDIDQALVHAETREEIDQIVCEQLTQSGRYHCAWIGEYDLSTETITPQEWAGIDASYFETLTTDDTPLGQGPIGTAARTHEVQVIGDIITDARFAPWREQTLEYGARSCIAVPLVYNEALYGVLTVYTSSPQTEADDHTVLGELGETIAHAINAVETKETLHTDSVVELELQFRDLDTPLCRLAQHADCRIDFEGLVPQSNGPAQVFFTAQGATPAAIQTARETTVAIEELTCLTDRDDNALFKAVVSNPILPSRLVEQDARVRTLTIEGETATAVIDLPSTAAVRAFIEDIQTKYPTTDLCRRRTRDRPVDTQHAFKTAVDDRLTDRQQDILQTAYMSGFFQSPRESTGQDLAAMLGISQPTFTEHLRAGQHTVFELLFDEA
jgi:PAS domain S-box-containing protein